jgi:hypothetical protein
MLPVLRIGENLDQDTPATAPQKKRTFSLLLPPAITGPSGLRSPKSREMKNVQLHRVAAGGIESKFGPACKSGACDC